MHPVLFLMLYCDLCIVFLKFFFYLRQFKLNFLHYITSESSPTYHGDRHRKDNGSLDDSKHAHGWRAWETSFYTSFRCAIMRQHDRWNMRSMLPRRRTVSKTWTAAAAVGLAQPGAVTYRWFAAALSSRERRVLLCNVAAGDYTASE